MPEESRCANCQKVIAVQTPSGLCEVCTRAQDTTAVKRAESSLPPTETYRPEAIPDLALNLDDAPTRTEQTRDSEEPILLHHESQQLATRNLQVVKQLQSGGMGDLYLAINKSTKRPEVIKFVRRFRDSAARSRFRREIEAQSRLNHPSIVQIYFAETQVEMPYFSMEWMDFSGLDHQIRQANKNQQFLDHTLVCELLLQASEGIEFAHQQGLLHRDLKPSNILLKQKPGSDPLQLEAKVSDYGLARSLDEEQEQTLTQPNEILGTPGYMAPEQALGQSTDARTDVYGLGATLYAALCNRAPYSTDRHDLRSAFQQAVMPPSYYRPDIPVDLEAICLKALQHDPEKRYPTARAFAEDLRAHLRGEPTLARPLTRTQRLIRKVRTRVNPGYLLLAIMLGIVMLLGAAMYGRERTPPESIADRLRDLRTDRELKPSPLELMLAGLDAGQKQTLIGEKGKPAWYGFPYGPVPFGEFVPGDDELTLEATDLTLLSLCPDPRSDHYRVEFDLRRVKLKSRENRPNPREKFNSSFGFFFGHEVKKFQTGEALQSYTFLVIHDFDPDLLSGKKNHNNIGSISDWQQETLLQRPLVNRSRYALNAGKQTRFGEATSQGIWRRFRVDVNRDILQAWVYQADGTLIDLGRTHKLSCYIDTSIPKHPFVDALKQNQFDFPEWNPRGSLGLYLNQASATVKNVTIEPLPKE